MSIRTELAAAVRRVNAAYNRCPNADEIDIFTDRWRTLEAKVDTALTAGDDAAARKAIQAWESHAVLTFTEATRG